MEQQKHSPVLIMRGFTETESDILQKAFAFHCDQLGLANRRFIVAAEKADLGTQAYLARVAQIPELSRKLFHMEFNSNCFNLFDATSSLGHELVHVRQYLNGDIVDNRDDNSITWKNQRFDADAAGVTGFDYLRLPWEREAWTLQGPLHKKFWYSLSVADQHIVNPDESRGPIDLWGCGEKLRRIFDGEPVFDLPSSFMEKA